MKSSTRMFAESLVVALAVIAAAACGSENEPRDASADAGPDGSSDAGGDAEADAGPDAQMDGGPDAGSDSGSDAGSDAAIVIPDFACAPVDVTAAPRLTGPRSVRNLRIGIVPLLLAGQDMSGMPTRAEIGEKYGGCDMQRLFYDGSTGEAALEVEVAPWQSISVTEMDLADDFVIEEAELSSVNVTVPAFSGETHFLVFLALFESGPLPGSWTYMEYGPEPFPRISLNGAQVPHQMMLTHLVAEFDRPRPFGYSFFDPRTGTFSGEAGLLEGEGRPIGATQGTFGHEMVHYLGRGPHANSWDRGERFFFEPSDVDAELRDDYGNHFALLGTSDALAPVIHSVYRRLIGWGRRLTEEVTAGEDRRVTIAPLNRLEGVTSVFFEVSPSQTIQLELREDDGWHDFIAGSPRLAGNLDGIMILVQDGDTSNEESLLIDASPMPRDSAAFPGTTLDDVVLKPGMELHMPQMSLTDARPEADAHMSVRIQTFATPREILHRPVRPTLSRMGNSATVTWAGSTHAETTGFEVEVVAADGTSVMTSVTGDTETSTTLDVSTIRMAGELHARVRAVGGGHPANWSRRAYVLP